MNIYLAVNSWGTTSRNISNSALCQGGCITLTLHLRLKG